MKEKTIFIAFDGKEFTSPSDCMNYESNEKRKADNERLVDALNIIKDFCSHKAYCGGCPFCVDIKHSIIGSQCGLRHSIPQQWELLDNNKEW